MLSRDSYFLSLMKLPEELQTLCYPVAGARGAPCMSHSPLYAASQGPPSFWDEGLGAVFMEITWLSGVEAARAGLVNFIPTHVNPMNRKVCADWASLASFISAGPKVRVLPIPKVARIGLGCGSGMTFT